MEKSSSPNQNGAEMFSVIVRSKDLNAEFSTHLITSLFRDRNLNS